MNLIEDIEVVCPYCGSSFAIEADTEGGSYSTTEDCAVCCRPIAVSIRCHPGKVESGGGGAGINFAWRESELRASPV